jgi:hypothetical protein
MHDEGVLPSMFEAKTDGAAGSWKENGGVGRIGGAFEHAGGARDGIAIEEVLNAQNHTPAIGLAAAEFQ